MSSIGKLVRKSQATLFWCMQGLPKAKREAIYTLYAFCKHIDNVIDGNIDEKEKLELLKAWQEELINIYDKKVPATNIGRKIYKNCMRFKIKKDDFKEILNAAMMDFPESLKAPEYENFYRYCYGTSEIPVYITLSIIGELDEEVKRDLSKSFGRAMFITDILKDVKEDALNGHLYMPKEVLNQAGILSTEPLTAVTDKNLVAVREQLAKNVSADFKRAFELLQYANKKITRPLRFILHIYKRYFDIMQNRGWEIMSPKPVIGVRDKLAIVSKVIFDK
jgi:phytoene synthase